MMLRRNRTAVVGDRRPHPLSSSRHTGGNHRPAHRRYGRLRHCGTAKAAITRHSTTACQSNTPRFPCGFTWQVQPAASRKTSFGVRYRNFFRGLSLRYMTSVSVHGFEQPIVYRTGLAMLFLLRNSGRGELPTSPQLLVLNASKLSCGYVDNSPLRPKNPWLHLTCELAADPCLLADRSDCNALGI